MTRAVLADGRWFDRDRARAWEEGTRWDGHNHVSLATGSQWDHERLYRTASGRWILHTWSQWQGARWSYREIDDDAAARWLALNEHDPHPACAKAHADLEVT